jgi:cytochrome c-type biogenesis protein CcsB
MKNLRFLFSPVFMGILFVVFALAMAVATFIENDFGSTTSYSMVYGSKWFELILLLLAINLVGQMIIFRLFRLSRLSGALFHLSFVLILAGAAITRYSGWEGSVHIREGETQNQVMSSKKNLLFTVEDSEGTILSRYSEEFSMMPGKAGKFEKAVNIGGKEYRISFSGMIPNATLQMVPDQNGKPVITFFVATESMMHGETFFLKEGDKITSGDITVAFDNSSPADMQITRKADKFYASSSFGMKEMSMQTRNSTDFQPGDTVELRRMQILSLKGIRLIPIDMSQAGSIQAVESKDQPTGKNAYSFDVNSNGFSQKIYVWDNESEDISKGSEIIDGKKFNISYGPEMKPLPFSLKLNDFILERYPGSNSPSGYKSDVVLIDKEQNVEKPFMIFMNNILKYRGYRFYQSSFDPDEKGTVLSVNHDIAGILVTYTGYALLFLFIIITLLNRNSVFYKVTSGYWNSNLRKVTTMLILLVMIAGAAPAQKLVPGKSAAEEFGKVLVQDQKGRTKPLFTMSNDIVRKVTKETRFDNLTSMQVFLGILLDFNNWKDVQMISVANKDLQSKLGIRGNKAAFSDIVNISGDGSYKISDDVQAAYKKAPGQRSKYDKEVMKVDERLNIMYMIYTGNFLKVFPLRDGSTQWGSPREALEKANVGVDSLFLKNVLPVLENAIGSGNPRDAIQVRETISAYQNRYAGYELPSATETKAELLYYKLNIFEKLFPFYATVGILMLGGLIYTVIRGKKRNPLLVKISTWLLFAGFLLHTFGLALRWYISGHSPMSNGYESMLFISWVTLLAGFIFSRKSDFTLSATSVLAFMTLLVAHMSFMDPEITNLVPVLKSYWLTLHVSVITGSYGFLGLGAILGFITLILLALTNTRNRERISVTIDELTVINYKTLTLGLYFLTIGTFLGAVWANESWGRYWGWDPKETWSLITIVVYSIVIHSRMIPGMKDIFTFNILSLFAFSSVLMTYFGVNYYLSGLHSYASGDAVPVPSFVYITIVVLAGLSLYAGSKYRKLKV